MVAAPVEKGAVVRNDEISLFRRKVFGKNFAPFFVEVVGGFVEQGIAFAREQRGELQFGLFPARKGVKGAKQRLFGQPEQVGFPLYLPKFRFGRDFFRKFVSALCWIGYGAGKTAARYAADGRAFVQLAAEDF